VVVHAEYNLVFYLFFAFNFVPFFSTGEYAGLV